MPADEELAAQLAALLRDHPEASVGALGRDALYVPIPASLAVGAHPTLQGRWPLDHVAAAEREPLSAEWRRLPEVGHVSIEVGLLNGGRATFHVFDVTGTHGVHVLVAIPHDGAEIGVARSSDDLGTISRFTRILRDHGGRTIEIDAAAPKVMGWSAEQLTDGSPPLMRVHPDDRGRMLETWVATIAEPASAQRTRVRLLRPDGSHRWFEVTTFNRLDDPHRPCVAMEFLDISEEMAAHEAVRAREQLLHRLAEALPLGVLQLELDGSIVYKNDVLSAIIGDIDATTLDEQFASIVGEDRTQLQRAFAAAVSDGSDDDVVVRMTPNGGRNERLIHVITKALRSDTGEPTGVIACISDVTEAETMGRELERRATYDALTGCRNRATILGHLERAAASTEHGIAVIFLDLDDFKAVNDQCGHAVGDAVLRAAARVLDAATREDDQIGRLGGDEFLVVCADVDQASAMDIAARISEAMRRHGPVAGSHLPLKASIGVAWAPAGEVDAHALIERADTAMYASKAEGRGVTHLWRDRVIRSA